MKSIAFITYNTLDGIQSGWTESNGHRALILQNTRGEGSLENGEPIGSVNRADQVETLWNKLLQVVSTIDQVVIYIGVRGSERAIALAAQLPSEKITFLMCRCSFELKVKMIEEAGLKQAKRIVCDCGGHEAMSTMVRDFLASADSSCNE